MTTLTCERQPKRRAIAVRLTADEHRLLVDYAREHCLNISALVRKLLFDEVRKDRPCKE